MKNKEKFIGSIVFIVILAISLIVGYKLSKPKEVNMKELFVNEKSNLNTELKVDSKTNSTADTKIDIKKTDEIIVYINGEVNKPDNYTMDADSRVKDLVLKAGGFTKNADKSKVNLAERLKDEEYIYISKIGETNTTANINTKTNTNTNTNSDTNNIATAQGRININKATKEELMKIDGIGEKTADKIIEYRESNGDYTSLEQLKDIGARIGDITLNKFRKELDIK